MTADEFSTRVSAYSDFLGARERTALLVAVPGILGSSAVLILLIVYVPSVRPLIAASIWGALLVSIGLWIVIRGLRTDRDYGVAVPCPKCGKELVMEADLVLAEGRCPICAETIIATAT